MAKAGEGSGDVAVKSRTGLLCCVALTLSLPATAWGGDAAEGEKLARRACAGCHSVAAGQSPMPEAPPFASIARSKRFRTRGSTLLTGSHVKMPNFAFTEEQAEDVTAYLKSLALRRVRH